MDGTIRIDSTTDTEAQVQAALGIANAPETPADAPVTPAPAPETPPATVVTAPVTPDAPAGAVKEPPSEEDRAAAKMSTRIETLKRQIDEHTRTKYDTKLEAEAIQRQVQQLRQEQAYLEAQRQSQPQLKRPVPGQPAPLAARPKQQDFTTLEDYETADERWIAARVEAAKAEAVGAAERAINDRFAQQQVQAEQFQQRQQFEQVQRQFEGRIAEAKTKYADFDTVTRADVAVPNALVDVIKFGVSGPDVSYYLGKNPEAAEVMVQLSQQGLLTPPVCDALKMSENAPDVLAHLAAHPDEAQRLASLPPLIALSQANRLAGRIAAQTEYAAAHPAAEVKPLPPPTVPMSKLAAPPRAVGGSAKSQVSLSDPDISHAEYKRIRLAQRQASGNRNW